MKSIRKTNNTSKYRVRRFYRNGLMLETFRNTKSGAYNAKRYYARMDKRYKNDGGCYRTTITKVR